MDLRAEYPNIHNYCLTWNVPDGHPAGHERERFAANCMTGSARAKAKKLLKRLMVNAPKDYVTAVTLRDETVGVKLGTIVAINGAIMRDWGH